MLRRLLEEWLPGLPLLCIPGNHDVPRSLRETFPESVSSSIWLRLLTSVIGSSSHRSSESRAGPGGG